VSDYLVTYSVARDFAHAGRTFHRGDVLAGDDPDVGILLRCETLLGRQLLFVRCQRVNRPALSSRASETVAWRRQASAQDRPRSRQVVSRPLAKTKARGYGSEHKRRRRQWAPQVARGEVCCARCHEVIWPGEPWDLDHTPDRTGYLGRPIAAATRRRLRTRPSGDGECCTPSKGEWCPVSGETQGGTGLAQKKKRSATPAVAKHPSSAQEKRSAGVSVAVVDFLSDLRLSGSRAGSRVPRHRHRPRPRRRHGGSAALRAGEVRP
jgi:hypothetical protein